MKNCDIRAGFNYLSSKLGFPLSVLNGAGAGFAVMFSYLYTLGQEHNYTYPLAISMGAKTFFINCVISYQVFKAETKKETVEEKKMNYTDNSRCEVEEESLKLDGNALVPRSVSDVSMAPLLQDHKPVYINTTSSNVFIVSSILSVGIDIVTNFLNTYAQFKLLGHNTDVGLEELGINIIAYTFATVASARTVLFTMKFSFELWDRIRASPPENRFKNYVGSFLCCSSKRNASSTTPGENHLKNFC